MNRNIRRLILGTLLATSTTGAALGVGIEAASATVSATVDTRTGPLNVRTGTSTQTAVAGQLRDGSVVSLACQASGQYISGAVRSTAQWDRLANGRWVSHAYVRVGTSLPSCATLDAPAGNPSGPRVRTDGGPLNVRTAPNTRSGLGGQVANGAALALSCQADGETVRGTVRATAQWDRLTSGGYVSHAYVQTNGYLPSCASLDAPPAPPTPAAPPTPTPAAPSSPAAPSTPTAPSTPAGANVHTDGGPLNVRTEPSSRSDVTSSLANGSTLTLTCQVNGETIRGTVRSTAQWDKLASGGYVSHAYVQTSQPLPACIATVPVSSPVPAPSTSPTTSPAPAPTPAQPATYAGTAHTEGGPLNIRSGPTTGASPAGQVANGGALTLTCAVAGDYISGAVRATSQWDKLTSGNYVSHAYVQTTATLPTCAGGAPVTGGAGPVGSMTNAQFIAAAVAPAQAGYREFGVPASVTIAQSILESGWGRSTLTKNDRNYFGIKCFSGSPGPIANGCHTYATYECTPGCYPTYASFRTYASITDSFRDHGMFLTTNSRYKPAFNYTHDADQFLYQIWKAGYATSPTYVANVQALMRQYNLYQYDRL